MFLIINSGYIPKQHKLINVFNDTQCLFFEVLTEVLNIT
jgi:hypothetical protein